MLRQGLHHLSTINTQCRREISRGHKRTQLARGRLRTPITLRRVHKCLDNLLRSNTCFGLEFLNGTRILLHERRTHERAPLLD